MHKISILIVITIMLLSVTACNGNKVNPVEEKNLSTENKKENTEISKKEEKIEEKPVLKELIDWKSQDYVYEYKQTIGKTSLSSKITRVGNYMYIDGGEESLLNTVKIQEETGLKTYNIFPKTMKGMVTENKNEELNKFRTLSHELMEEKPHKDMIKVGEEKIAGRMTDKYYLEKTVPKIAENGKDLVTKSTMWIDQEYEIVLKKEVITNGESQSYFEITSIEFKTEDMSIFPDLTKYEFPVEEETKE